MTRVVALQSPAKLTVAGSLALRDELVVLYQGEAVFSRDFLGSFTGENPRRTITFFQNEPRQHHGVFDPLHTDHRAVIETAPAHDPAIELYLSLEIQNASPAGIEDPV